MSHLAPPIAQLATPTPLMLCVPHTWEWCGCGLGSGQALLTKAYFRLNFVYVPLCYGLRSDATALGVSGPVLPMSHDCGNDYDHMDVPIFWLKCLIDGLSNIDSTHPVYTTVMTSWYKDC